MTSYAFLPPALTSSIIITFILYSLKFQLHSKQYRALLILCINTIWWNLSWVFLFLTRDESVAYFIAKLGHVGILALPLTFHFFYSVLANRGPYLLNAKICIYIFFLASLIFTDWVIKGVNLFSWGFYPKAGILHPLFLLLTTYCIISGLLLCNGEIKRTKDPLKKKVIQFCQLAGIIYSFGSVDFLLNYNLGKNYPFGFLFSVIFIVIVSYTVSSFEFFSKEAKLKEELRKAQRERKEGEIKLGQLAAQVAHDLRSPLAALGVTVAQLDGVPTDHLELIHNSIGRIRDIANDLLLQSKSEKKVRSCLLSDLIERLLIEKRTQYQTLSDVKFGFEVVESNRDIWASIDASEFNRILSNLINNSVESLNHSGEILISLSNNIHRGDLEYAIITVSDNGKGIPPDVLKQLGQRGFSFGKSEGNGLGLHHAISTMNRWGGSLNIESKVGAGTKVKLTLPIMKQGISADHNLCE